MANITIDGVRLNVPDNMSVLEAALQNGIYIPHLCHHPDLPENGSCRLCIVQVDGMEGVHTSCTLKAKDGMVITTKNAKLDRLRAMSLELVLAHHPEECSTCPKFGNCELQMLMQYLGGASEKMKSRTRGFKENLENPLIDHDMNRCILCGRCVRACNDLRGVGVLNYQKKGMETYVGTLHDKLLSDSDCRFCQACAEVCPTGTIRDRLMMNNKDNKPKDEVVVPCRADCPAHADVPRYVRYVSQGEWDLAAAVIHEKLPFPQTLGMICNHACEAGCKRNYLGKPISIRNIKRYAAEHDTGSLWRGKGKQLPDTGKKVCVVGAGPAGMTAALYLRKQGHDVTIKEALPTVGGMLCYGIPAYRLPRDIVEKEFADIRATGVKTEFNCRVEKPVELLKEYDAVLLALGTHNGVRLPMPGSDLPGVLINTTFLRQASLGEATGMGKKVIVLGGGNVAFDCARTAKRLGAEEIHLACLEARDKMTADDEEIEEATEEGIFVHPAQTFEKITGETSVTGVDFMNVESFTFDENRRAIIKKEPGSEHHIDADTVIFATGQRCGISADAGIELGRANSIAVQGKTLKTSVEGIFAAGDAVYGTKSVIQAVASGRDAASEIDIFLGGDGDISEVFAPTEPACGKIGRVEGFAKLERHMPEIKCAAERQDNFGLFNMGICGEEICQEAGRCLQCDLRLQITPPRLWGDYTNAEEA